MIILIYLLGEPVYDKGGELVCTKPFPSMPTHFWDDEDGIKYHKAYFAKYRGNFIILLLGFFYI